MGPKNPVPPPLGGPARTTLGPAIRAVPRSDLSTSFTLQFYTPESRVEHLCCESMAAQLPLQ